MKKLINTSGLYAILALISGVFYREFTKFNQFDGRTTLSFLHVHLFVLGMMFFLVAALMEQVFSLSLDRKFRRFYLLYNAGMAVSFLTMAVRGVGQALLTEWPRGLDASISGVSGIGHILLAAGLYFFFTALRARASVSS